MSDLTPRQEQVLTALVELVEEKGHAPSLYELGTRTGISSSSVVAQHLRDLEHLGYIVRDPDNARAIRLLTRKCEVCGERIAGGPFCSGCQFAEARTDEIAARGKEWSA